MSSFRPRPRFEHTLPKSPDQVQARLVAALSPAPPPFELKVFPGFLARWYRERDLRTWTPHLNLSLDPGPNGGTLVQGRYEPNPEVWSVFLYGYPISASASLFGGIFGFCQLVLDYRPWGLAVLGGAVTLAVVLYRANQLGQKLGAEQTFRLHQAYESAVGQRASLL
jgi:hypothetical protein